MDRLNNSNNHKNRKKLKSNKTKIFKQKFCFYNDLFLGTT